MPSQARPLTVVEQYGALVLWAEVDATAPHVTRIFYVRGTGHPMRGAEGCPHVGTVFLTGPRGLVFHVFDGGEAQ